MDVYEELIRLRRSGQKCALATIVEVNGSIPSYESAKMLVREDGSIAGTIGGGCVEAEVWNAAREVMQTERPRSLRFSLGESAAYDNGLICGGQLSVFVEPVVPQPVAFIFGAGHISKSLSQTASIAGFATAIVDNREAFANRERFPEAREIFAEEYETVFSKLDVRDTTYIVIVTRGHRDDMRVLRLIIFDDVTDRDELERRLVQAANALPVGLRIRVDWLDLRDGDSEVIADAINHSRVRTASRRLADYGRAFQHLEVVAEVLRGRNRSG